MKIIAALICLLLVPVAQADDAMMMAYDAGRYEDALNLAEETSVSADRYAFQARSLLANCIFIGGNPPADTLKRAEAYARDALRLDENHLEGRMQLAIALSIQTRDMSLREIDQSGYGTLARGLAESILEDDPDNAWANGFLSVWHIEARRVAGAFLSGIVGASLRKSREHFDAAMAADPDNLTLKWQYLRALMAFNPKRFDDEIEDGLIEIAGADPQDALEMVLKERATAYIPLMKSREFDEIAELAKVTL